MTLSTSEKEGLMRSKFVSVVLSLALAVGVGFIAAAHAENGMGFKTFKVYTDGKAPDNHYIPSGWMGDWGDLKYDDKHMDNRHGGTTSIKIVYNVKTPQS